jgi:hypothetical protein
VVSGAGCRQRDPQGARVRRPASFRSRRFEIWAAERHGAAFGHLIPMPHTKGRCSRDLAPALYSGRRRFTVRPGPIPDTRRPLAEKVSGQADENGGSELEPPFQKTVWIFGLSP